MKRYDKLHEESCLHQRRTQDESIYIVMKPVDPQTSERTAKIIAYTGSFKICEACDSIIAKKLTLCPNCSGYRFDEDPSAVVLETQLLATRPQTNVTAADLV